jgi:hypothetical protein
MTGTALEGYRLAPIEGRSEAEVATELAEATPVTSAPRSRDTNSTRRLTAVAWSGAGHGKVSVYDPTLPSPGRATGRSFALF